MPRPTSDKPWYVVHNGKIHSFETRDEADAYRKTITRFNPQNKTVAIRYLQEDDEI